MVAEVTAISGAKIAAIENSVNKPAVNESIAELQRQNPNAVGAQQAIDKVTESADAKAVQPEPEADALNKQQLEQIAKELEAFLNANQRALSFHVDDSTGSDVVVVKDVKADEVIRQIPSEEMLKLALRMSDLSGALLSTEV